jgi:hypothetical protein
MGGSQSGMLVRTFSLFTGYVILPQNLRISDQELPTLAACYLPDGDVKAVEEVGGGDHKDQDRESLLVVVPSGLVPDRVGDRVRLIGYTGDSLGERQCGTFGGGPVGGIPPGGHGEEALVGFARLLEEATMLVNAGTTAVDLARAQLDKANRP